ncbi:MAG: Y-family DNA polymerase [Deltaproteobacteria bacterium]|jgi:DNA polymerase V|nr:Y-family DNA polymerase [Deltaproteobacteria bacterium]
MPFTASEIFGLIDCNNFYVSCERLFRPDLTNRAVVVLSNNDGCIIARSNEAKALGIGMGTPYFKQEALIRKNKIAVFSSNYPLYGDISQRVMDVLMRLESEVEVYSIDEAFIRIPAGKHHDLKNHMCFLKATVEKHTGIPVSIGLGPTKTLAKIANSFAKQDPSGAGIFIMPHKQHLDALLATVDITDIWGIGRSHASRLKKQSVHTALELTNQADSWIRKQLTVTGLRTAMELRGTPCISLEKAAPSKKSICTSRSFGQTVQSLADLQEAVATYTSQAAYKLRRAGLRTTVIDVFIRTNSFKRGEPQYCNRRTFTLETPSSHTGTLIKVALASLKAIYRSGYRYQKAGVLLNGLVPENYEQLRLFSTPMSQTTPVMKAVDEINKRWGRDTIQAAAAGLAKGWRFRQLKKSPAYTTCWSELPIVKASFPESFSVA